MKALNFLNPQKWIGQISVLAVFFLSGSIFGGYMLKKHFPCPPTTQVNVDQKIKAKKNSNVKSVLETSTESSTCVDWLKSLSNKEVRNFRK